MKKVTITFYSENNYKTIEDGLLQIINVELTTPSKKQGVDYVKYKIENICECSGNRVCVKCANIPLI